MTLNDWDICWTNNPPSVNSQNFRWSVCVNFYVPSPGMTQSCTCTQPLLNQMAILVIDQAIGKSQTCVETNSRFSMPSPIGGKLNLLTKSAVLYFPNVLCTFVFIYWAISWYAKRTMISVADGSWQRAVQVYSTEFSRKSRNHRSRRHM